MIYKGSRYVGAKMFLDAEQDMPYLAPTETTIQKHEDDLVYQFKAGDRIDILAKKFYGDPQAHWMILYANPEFETEFDIKEGDLLTIPNPERVNINEYGIG
jgi:nucleoid-associated protein YgaU